MKYVPVSLAWLAGAVLLAVVAAGCGQEGQTVFHGEARGEKDEHADCDHAPGEEHKDEHADGDHDSGEDHEGESETSHAGDKALVPQKTCPVMGGKITRQFHADFEGKRVYFCCQSCVGAFEKNPKKYLAKLASLGERPERVE